MDLFGYEIKTPVKLRHCEKATKFEKISHQFWPAKQLFLLSSIKTSGRFFQIFVALSEKLDFTSPWQEKTLELWGLQN